MKIGIYGQFYHKEAERYVQQLFDILDSKNIEAVVEKHFLDSINAHKDIPKDYNHFSTFKELDGSYDLFISIGGDGTMLKTVTYVRDLNIPIVGINTGRLGFLATIKKESLEQSINAVIDGRYRVSERSLLQVSTDGDNSVFGDFHYALNEIAISRRNTTSMISVSTQLNNEQLTHYWADGLIIASPTGSTGYSLSCGGPVIAPDAQSFVITPIAPHNLNARPLVIPDTTAITLEVSGREEQHLISLDSRIATLNNGTKITITKAPFSIKLVLLEDDSFLKTIREKLLWGEDKRN